MRVLDPGRVIRSFALRWRLSLVALQASCFKNSPRALKSAALRDRGGEPVLAIHRVCLALLRETSAHGFRSVPEFEGQLGTWVGW